MSAIRTLHPCEAVEQVEAGSFEMAVCEGPALRRLHPATGKFWWCCDRHALIHGPTDPGEANG